jgi:hypothetical protein
VPSDEERIESALNESEWNLAATSTTLERAPFKYSAYRSAAQQNDACKKDLKKGGRHGALRALARKTAHSQ